MTLPEIRSVALTALFGAIGALAAFYLNVPAPFLLGPATVITLAGLLGVRFSIPMALRQICFLLVGISMGTAVTPEVIEAARTWPFSFVMVIVAVIALLYLGYAILRYGFGYDHRSSILASSPGHLSYIISLGANMGVDLASISVIQSVRVLALTLIVPIVVEVFDLKELAPSVPAEAMALPLLAITLALSAALGLLFQRWRMPAAFLLGAVAVSVTGHITGISPGSVPQWLLIPAYVTLGCLIGSRFSGVSILDLRKAFIAGAVVTVAVTVFAALVALLVTEVTGLPLNATMIAFAPGGLETMAAMAIMMHADATYVGAHHVLRILFLSVFVPVALRGGKRKAATPGENP